MSADHLKATPRAVMTTLFSARMTFEESVEAVRARAGDDLRPVEAALGGNFDRHANRIRGQSQAAHPEALMAIVEHIRRRFGPRAVRWASDTSAKVDTDERRH
jgi:hypothetical protein